MNRWSKSFSFLKKKQNCVIQSNNADESRALIVVDKAYLPAEELACGSPQEVCSRLHCVFPYTGKGWNTFG